MNTLFFLFLACGDKDEDTATTEPSGEPSTEASTEPSGEASAEPSGEASAEPSGEASAEPAGEASAEPSGEASSEPAGEASSEPAGEASAEPSGEASAEPAAEASEEPPPPPAFCDLYADTCGAWTADVACPEWYNGAAATGDTEGAGANQACYDYHLNVASTLTDQAEIDMHCTHAVGGTDANGGAPCTDAPAE